MTRCPLCGAFKMEQELGLYCDRCEKMVDDATNGLLAVTGTDGGGSGVVGDGDC